IRTISMVAGLIVLIFFLLYMCGDGLNNSSAEEIIQEQFDSDRQLKMLKSDANKLQATYLNAIERRNQDALELVGLIDDGKLKNSFSKSILSYDYGHINASEQIYRLNLSDVKNNVSIPQELTIKLDGGDNRINTAKKRYYEGVAAYNTLLETSNDVKGNFESMETLK
ncbi:MAG: hypothetical protein MK066_07370, partial [Crocinitomicaceae bacterium]|nr:hypothetical protein [Crocinitomicaceae bacterium]